MDRTIYIKIYFFQIIRSEVYSKCRFFLETDVEGFYICSNTSNLNFVTEDRCCLFAEGMKLKHTLTDKTQHNS